MAIFNSYVSLPEGKSSASTVLPNLDPFLSPVGQRISEVNLLKDSPRVRREGIHHWRHV